jgi:hypothetical protein
MQIEPTFVDAATGLRAYILLRSSRAVWQVYRCARFRVIVEKQLPYLVANVPSVGVLRFGLGATVTQTNEPGYAHAVIARNATLCIELFV